VICLKRRSPYIDISGGFTHKKGQISNLFDS
jgi:hypothetical protein